MPLTLLDLPLDVLGVLFPLSTLIPLPDWCDDQAVVKATRRDLVALSLTCRLLYDTAQPFLYQVVDSRSTPLSPALTSRWSSVRYMRLKRTDLAQRKVEQINRGLLEATPTLVSLRLDAFHLDADALRAIFTSPVLRALDLVDISCAGRGLFETKMRTNELRYLALSHTAGGRADMGMPRSLCAIVMATCGRVETFVLAGHHLPTSANAAEHREANVHRHTLLDLCALPSIRSLSLLPYFGAAEFDLLPLLQALAVCLPVLH